MEAGDQGNVCCVDTSTIKYTSKQAAIHFVDFHFKYVIRIITFAHKHTALACVCVCYTVVYLVKMATQLVSRSFLCFTVYCVCARFDLVRFAVRHELM